MLGIVTGDANDLSWRLVNGLAGSAGEALTLQSESLDPRYTGLVMTVSAFTTCEGQTCLAKVWDALQCPFS